MDTEFTVRPAGLADVQDITDIYNQAIRSTVATFDVEEKTLEDRKHWLESHGERYPVVVSLCGDRIVGWGSISPYAERKAYEFTVENSIYIHPDFQGRGVGALVLAKLIEESSALGFHTIVALIVGGNEASIKLHEKFGFEIVGMLKEVGRKFDKWLDILLMQKSL